jgi:FdhD protein
MEKVSHAWRQYEGIKHDPSKGIFQVEDGMVIEKGLQLILNEEPFTMTMRMPGHEKELALGLLYAEDIITHSENIHFNLITTDKDIDQLHIQLPPEQLKEGYLNSRNFLSVSSCGVCGKTTMPQLDGTPLNDSLRATYDFEAIYLKMASHQTVFSHTGGCHAAAVYSANGELLVVMEDIGRHNAVDKCIGHLLLTKQLPEAHILAVSGRVSYEIVIKCFRAKIPLLTAVSAPSSLAIDYCKELGIHLFAFCRDKKFTQYS